MIRIDSAQDKPMNCLIYLRVSSGEQVKNFSLETQEEICTEASSKAGYKILKIFKEKGASAKTADRLVLKEMLQYCKKHQKKISKVFVYRVDRMARDTSDYLAIKKRLNSYGIQLESATEPTGTSPTERFIETILVAGAQMDNEIKAEKVRNGMYKRFREGYHSGHAPLGYKSVEVDGRKTLVRDEKSFELMRSCWELMGTGTKSLSEVTDIMNKLKLTVKWGKRQKPITLQTASRIFSNKKYCGILTSPKYPTEEVKAIFEPMISQELFYRVRAIISRRTRGSINP